MKKTILLSLLCAVAMITACKDENERDIVGIWVYEKHLYELLENGSVKDVEECKYTEDGEYNFDTLTFDKKGSCCLESGYFIGDGDDRSLFKYAVCGKYTIDGKVITKDMGNDWIEKDTIVELTNDKFVYISHLIADIHLRITSTMRKIDD